MTQPELPYGYLGPQGKWQEFGLSTISHNSPEIKTDKSELEIKLKTNKPTKITTNLLGCPNDTEYKDLVFTQTQGGDITLVVQLPSAGFFKLQIYALPMADDSKNLPNVYNYLIHNTHCPRCPPAPFPKQYAQWKEGCFLHEPFNLSTGSLDSVNFKVVIPNAKAVAVTVDGEWYHLNQGADKAWTGQVKGLAQKRGKNTKASLNANFGGDETKYSSLLEYHL